LSIWFAVHVVFSRVASRDVGPLRLIVPDWASLDVAALVLVAVALVLQFRFNTGVVTLLAACAGLSVAIAWAGVRALSGDAVAGQQPQDLDFLRQLDQELLV